MITRMIPIALIVSLFFFLQGVFAQEEAKIESIKVTDQIYMLTGQGGNLGLFVGKDGTFLIDDQFAPLTEKIIAAIESVGGDVPKFLINTHYHGDHTGGNENFGSPAELSSYLQMLETAYERLRKLKAEGKTAEEAIEAKPLADLEEEWGDGIFTGDKWIGIIYPGV